MRRLAAQAWAPNRPPPSPAVLSSTGSSHRPLIGWRVGLRGAQALPFLAASATLQSGLGGSRFSDETIPPSGAQCGAVLVCQALQECSAGTTEGPALVSIALPSEASCREHTRLGVQMRTITCGANGEPPPLAQRRAEADGPTCCLPRNASSLLAATQRRVCCGGERLGPTYTHANLPISMLTASSWQPGQRCRAVWAASRSRL